MFQQLLDLRKETFETPLDFKFIRPEKQDKFNEVMREMATNQRPVVIPQDDDTDGGVCVVLFYEVLRYINPSKTIDVYMPEEKCHGVTYEFASYVKANFNNPYIIVTDSSSDCLDVLKELSQIGDVIHIDHHQSDNEVQLDQICKFHANCRYDASEPLHYLSAGFYSYMHLACYLLENSQPTGEFLDKQFTLATLSLVADVCDLTTKYNRSIIKHYMTCQHKHPILELFRTKFSRYDIYFLAFTVAPKINMLFRLRYMNYLRQLFLGKNKEDVVSNIEIIYSNYRATVRESLNYLDVSDYGKFAITDISHINNVYPVFNNKVSNFTGWYANQLSQLLSKPVIAMCNTYSTLFKGSVRDFTSQDVYSIMDNLPYVDGGGHVSAYGFTIDASNVRDLISSFYYGYPDEKITFESTVPINSLIEIDNLWHTRELEKFAEYNDYTINDKIGFLYTIKYSDTLDRRNRHTLIGNLKLKIICFQDNLQPKDVVKLIPDYTNNGIQLIAEIVERGGTL